jgi:oxygen-independent coproporphyrinogen-3 oxidase
VTLGMPSARAARRATGTLEPSCSRARDEARAGLYVHVPFCATRCTYCDFSSGRLSAAAVERYLDAMARECAWRSVEASGITFTSLFFGGGTPSALPSRAFRQLWAMLHASFVVAPDAEVTLEANPESVRDSLLATWRECGVNRLSFGVQSFDDAELARLGRIHDSERPGEAVRLARAHGFRRLSLDLMFGFPGHALDRWSRTLERAIALEPEHVSAYCFIPEAGTPMGDDVLAGRVSLPDDDRQAELYERLTARLAESGYACYETSNFCRSGAEARHNLVYWLRRPYEGLGPSAHGLVNGRRHGNHYALERWASALERGEAPEHLSEPETRESRAREIVMLALRLGCGLHLEDLEPDARIDVERRYGAALLQAVRTGRLERCQRGVRIPERLRFLADDVVAWIEAVAEASIDRVPSGSIICGSWNPTPSLAV